MMIKMEKSLLIEFLGDTPIVRVLDFLLVFRKFDYNKQDIAINSNVSWNTLDKIWGMLIKNNIIIKTRKVGKSNMYELNMENPAVKKLIELHKTLMIKSIKDIEETKEILVNI